MQRSVTSVHPKRHERRPDGISFRMHGRSSISSHKVVPLATENKQEDLLINFNDDCSAVPQATPMPAGHQQSVAQSSADVLSLLDSSIADKYQCLPPALGEKERVPYDPFEISEDLKTYASQNVAPLHGDSTAPTQQYDVSSLHHSWSSFDSFSSQEANEANELASPTPAFSQDRVASKESFMLSTAGRASAAGATDADTKTGATGIEINSLTYANVPLMTGDDNEGKQQTLNYSSQHSYSYSDCSRPSSRRRRWRDDRHNQVASREVVSDVNANSVAPRPVSICDSADRFSNVISQLSLRNTSASQSVTAISSAAGQTLVADTGWDGTSLSRSMKAAKKKVPNTGSVFYDDVDKDHEDETRLKSCRDWNSDNRTPPLPPRDYVHEDRTRTFKHSGGIYANVGQRNPGFVSSDTAGTRQLAEVRPFVHTSFDVYQNYSEFSQSAVDNADHSMYANMTEQSSMQRGSFAEATALSEVGQFGDESGQSAIYRIRRRVPAATLEDCQAALISCYSDVESAVRHLKVQQLTRLGIAPHERCQMLLEACNWNLESAGSVLLHELSTGSPV